MKKTFLIFYSLLLLLILQSTTSAQDTRGTIGVGISGGAMNYEGDLDDNFTLVFTKPAFGLHAIFVVFPEYIFVLQYYMEVLLRMMHRLISRAMDKET
ncbi:MAG: hypothetical protein IPN61_00255 [Bacteroidetes bacterium]|nr:hypothetical protein [Bacteroidota bacterium]